MLISISCTLNLKLYQMDVKSVFLNRSLKEELCIAQSKRFQNHHYSDCMLKLKKLIYGLKQAPRAYYDRLTTFFFYSILDFLVVVSIELCFLKELILTCMYHKFMWMKLFLEVQVIFG